MLRRSFWHCGFAWIARDNWIVDRLIIHGSGAGASTVTVTFRGTVDTAPDAATQAIRNLGGQDISFIGSNVTTGWIGSVWTNIPQMPGVPTLSGDRGRRGEPLVLAVLRPAEKGLGRIAVLDLAVHLGRQPQRRTG